MILEESMQNKKEMNSYSQQQMAQQNCQGKTTKFREPTLRRERTVRSENLSGELQGESGESQPAETADDAEALADFWSIQGDFIYRHHIEPRVQLHVPKEETFPIPLKYIDVTRSTHTDLDVIQEKRIDDYWNVDSSKHLSDSWRGFTKFTPLARTCDSMRRVFLSHCGARVNSQDHGQSQVHMSKQLNREGQTTIHKLKTR